VSAGLVNESEREFGAILDFYQIAWQYEPHSFPVAWDSEGRPTSYFSPDFYLTDLDIYIELTTLKQSLVTKKNRKVRLLRELYPDVQIKLLYARDFHSLMRKYGLSQSYAGPLPAPSAAIGSDAPEVRG
jgi:bifunctional protein TilS/HprT